MKVLNPKLLKEKIKFYPHPAQREILLNLKRFSVICAGRRFGKSILTSYLALKEGLLNNRKIWIVAPTYDLAKRSFDYLTKWTSNYFPANSFKINFSTLSIDCPHNSKIVFKSAENPTSLIGESLDLLIMDEASRIKKDIWEANLRPSLSDREGRMVAISTPLSKENWFYSLFVRGQDPENKNWVSFVFPSTENPSLSKADLEEAKATLPEVVWQQEYEASFLDSAYAVFRGVRACISPNLPRKNFKQSNYVIGIDLAKMNDYSVCIVADTLTNEVVEIDRYQKVPYTLQKERIIKLAKAYHPSKLIVDSGSIGGAIADDLRLALGDLRVQDYALVGTISKDFNKKGSKQILIERLSQMIEAQAIHIPENEVLINELESYGMELSEKGNVRYGAPTGQHDDCVISLALCAFGLKTEEKRKKTQRIRKIQEANRIVRRPQYF